MSVASNQVTVFGSFGDPVRFGRRRSDPQPFHGLYDTEVGYGGRRWPANHQLWLHADGAAVLGVAVRAPHWTGTTLAFADQGDATGGGKPLAAEIRFTEDGFSGWCQFPGDGRVEWYGRRIGDGPPIREWVTDVEYGGRWWAEDHALAIAPGRVTVAGTPVTWPVFTPAGLRFSGQVGARRDGLPESADIQFTGTGFTGWCQFPGEGRVGWRDRRAAAHPPHGRYTTAVQYGGRWWDEDHPVVIGPGGVTIAGVPVAGAVMGGASLAFDSQPDARRDAKPVAGFLGFTGDACEGWCQFPGEGRLPWRGHRDPAG